MQLRVIQSAIPFARRKKHGPHRFHATKLTQIFEKGVPLP